VLFEHDRQMVTLRGKDNYIRWMDDQNFGAASSAEGLRILAEVGKSLARFHLTANAKKSKILTLAQARRHFHLDHNALLDEAEEMAKKQPKGKAAFTKLINRTWRLAKKHEGVGEFDKILDRLYRLAGRARLKIFHGRAFDDLLKKPEISDRVCEYMRCTNTPRQYIKFVEAALAHDEQIYADVSVILVESLLRVEADSSSAQRIRAIASAFLKNKMAVSGETECKAIAPMLILRFGDRRSMSSLFNCIEDDSGRNSTAVVRASAIVHASFGMDEYRRVRKAASKLFRSPLPETIRLIERIREYKKIPDRYKNRLRLRNDSVSGRLFVDMRSIITIRLLALSSNASVKAWVRDWKANMIAARISRFDRNLLKRLVR
jgi:hypothetical protein